MADRTEQYVKALDELDELKASGQVTANEWEVRRTALLSEVNPSVGTAIGRFVYLMLGVVLLIVVVLLVLALVGR